jgi:predicted enzyme related to lactoylglutathione lyase
MSKPVSVRYIVNDVDAAIEFYTKRLDFKVEMHPAAEFAILSRENMRLLLSKPSGRGGGGQRMADGTIQTPGGWNRFEIEVDDLDSTITKLREAGCTFRNKLVTGVGGRQILLENPSGNPIELFQYFKDSAKH